MGYVVKANAPYGWQTTPTPELGGVKQLSADRDISAFKDSKGYGYKYASEESINDCHPPSLALGLRPLLTCLPTDSEFDGNGPGRLTSPWL